MGNTKDVYMETAALVDAVLDGQLTEGQAKEQISKSYGNSFGEFLIEELETERTKRTPGKGTKYFEGLVFRLASMPLLHLASIDVDGPVKVTKNFGPEVLGFADVWRGGEGLNARIYLSEEVADLYNTDLWAACGFATNSDGKTFLSEVALCEWPSHDPAIPSLVCRTIGGGDDGNDKE